MPRERGTGEGSRASSSICLPVSCLHSHHDLIQSFPCEVGHRGVFAGVPYREQHQEFFIGGAVQKHSQTGATVERRGGDSHQSSILQQERKRKSILKLAGKTPALLVAWTHSSPSKTVCPTVGQKRSYQLEQCCLESFLPSSTSPDPISEPNSVKLLREESTSLILHWCLKKWEWLFHGKKFEVSNHTKTAYYMSAYLDSILKSRNIILPTKARLVKALFFSSTHIWM